MGARPHRRGGTVNQAEIAFLPPAHEALVEERAAEIKAWLVHEFARLRDDVDSRLKHIRATHARSVSQRRRFWRLRSIQERTA